MYQPNEPKFYDGSITQVLQNPTLNPSMAQNQHFMVQNPQVNHVQGSGGNPETAEKHEEDKEKTIDTKAQASLEASMPTMHGNQGKILRKCCRNTL